MDLDRDFLDIKEKKNFPIHGKELVEDKFIVRRLFSFLDQVVPPFSGARYFGNPYKVPNSTHFTIATVSGPDEIQHRLLVEFLTEFGTITNFTSTTPTKGTTPTTIAIGFPDSIHADLVKCQLVTKSTARKHHDIEITWPQRTLHHIALTKTLLEEASDYFHPRSSFYGQSQSVVADFINRAHYAEQTAHNIVDCASTRAGLLVDGMLQYWTSALDNIIATSLANFLTICNVELLYANMEVLREDHLYKKYFPTELEQWFSRQSHRAFYRQVFDIKQPLASAKVVTLSGTDMSTYFWGPQEEVIESAHWRAGEPIRGTWFDKYLIPQNEYRLLQEQSDELFWYDETLSIVKVINDNNEEIA